MSARGGLLLPLSWRFAAELWCELCSQAISLSRWTVRYYVSYSTGSITRPLTMAPVCSSNVGSPKHGSHRGLAVVRVSGLFPHFVSLPSPIGLLQTSVLLFLPSCSLPLTLSTPRLLHPNSIDRDSGELLLSPERIVQSSHSINAHRNHPPKPQPTDPQAPSSHPSK